MADQKRIFTVLVIDGGGVRGIMPARILEEIENKTGKPAAELFDLIGGVSTGAILGAGLTVPDPDKPGKPRYSAAYLKDLYFKHAPRIFPEFRFKSLRKISSSAAYDPTPLEETLQSYFGDHKMRDSLVHLMIPATDIKNFRPVWIKSIKGEKDTSPENWSSMLIKDAVRAATTAPTYFPAKYYQTTPSDDLPGVGHRHALIDGGFFGGNACRRVLTQARKLAPPDAEIVIVHLGTGCVENSMSPDEWNRLGPLGMLNKAKGSVLISLATDMGMIDTLDDVREELGDRLISLDSTIDFEDKTNDPSTSMDDASPENMKKLEKMALDIIAENKNDFDRLCTMLETRLMTEQKHLESAQALAELVARMEKVHTVKNLTKFYRNVLDATTGLGDSANDNKNKKGDATDPEAAEIRALALQLTDKHREDLDRLYNVQQDKLENQNRLVNSAKEAGENVSGFFKKITDMFNKSSDKDDTPPPAANDKGKAPAPAKKPFWRR